MRVERAEVYSVLQVVGDGAAGGGTTVVLGLSQHLLRSGASVTIATQAASYLVDEARRHDIPVLELDFGSRRRSALLALALGRHLRISKPAIIHCHGSRSGLPAALLPAALRGPMVFTVHGFHFRNKQPAMRELSRRAERFCIRRATETVFVSYKDEVFARREHLIRADDAYQVIRNGCAPTEPSRQLPAFDLAFLGRLHAQKNPAILLDILVALRPSRPTLRFIGGGEMEPVLRQRAVELGLSNQVSFTGVLPHDEALNQLQRVGVLMLPSRWEGLPMAVIEAMHRGIPVVGSNVTGTDELVVDGQTGFLVGADDVTGYAERVRRLQDDGLRHDMGQNALRRAREHFALERQMNEHLALYRRVLPTGGANDAAGRIDARC